MDDKGKELCPRLTDYLVVVGRRNRARGVSQPAIFSDVTNSAQYMTISNPDLLRRYPTDDHKDFILPTDVVVFCQPEGCTTICKPWHVLFNHETASHGRRGMVRDSSSFVFMLTEKDSAKIRYGICLNFFQAYERKMSQAAPVRKESTGQKRRRDHAMSLTSLCLITHHPFVSIFNDLLVLLKRLIDAANRRASLATETWSGQYSLVTGLTRSLTR